MANTTSAQLITAALAGPAREVELHCTQHGPYTGKAFVLGGQERTPACPTCLDRRADTERKAAVVAFDAARRNSLAAKYGHAGIPPRFLRHDFGTYVARGPEQARWLNTAREYARNFEAHLSEGRGLLVVGQPGTGKTHLVAAICKEVISAGRSALFTTTLQAVQVVKETYRPGAPDTERLAIQRFSEPDLLVLDEVGVQHGSETERVILTDLINRRYEHLRPTILLSNLGYEKLVQYLGLRVVDRLRECAELVTCQWGSWRAGNR